MAFWHNPEKVTNDLGTDINIEHLKLKSFGTNNIKKLSMS